MTSTKPAPPKLCPPTLPDAEHIRSDVAHALQEDIGPGDINAQLIPAEQIARARIICREAATFCGSAWAEEVFKQLDPSVEFHWYVADGTQVQAEQTLVEIRGHSRALLSGERAALNFLQTLSGTATQSALYAARIKGTESRVLDTRKTLPGLRRGQKYAVRCGGCHNHRMGLYDAFLIKENHIAAAGSIAQAVDQARAIDAERTLEVEVENLNELDEALSRRVDWIMLDNFNLESLRKAVQINTSKGPARAKLEASGNVSLDNIRSIAETGVDYISVGAITKHCRAIDLSMRLI